MKLAIIDTNVASFIYGQKAQAALYEETLAGRRIEVSFQTVAELLLGAELGGWGAPRRRALLAFVRTLRPVPYELELGRVWAQVLAASRRQGRGLTTGDAWIAAAAVHRRAPLVAHDRDFVGLEIRGLEVVSFA